MRSTWCTSISSDHAANNGSLYFLLLKDTKTHYVWVRLITKKSDVLVVFDKWLKVVEWQTSKMVKMMHFDRGGEFLGRAFTDLVKDKAQSVMPLHSAAEQHGGAGDAHGRRGCANDASAHRREAPLVAPRSTKLVPKAHSGLHLGVSAESKGWEVLDLTDNKVVTTVKVIFYETLSLEMWKVEYGPVSKRTPSTPRTDSVSVHPPLLAADDELDEDDTDGVTPSHPPLVQGSSSAAGDEGRLGASPAAPTSCIACGQRDAEKVNNGKRKTTGESSTSKKTAEKPSAEVPTAEKPSAEASTSGEPSLEELPTGEQFGDDSSSDVVEVVGVPGGNEWELLTGEQSNDNDVVEIAVKKAKP
ncbi:unnamed protein product [Closterium sp. NIES-53]